MKQEHKDWLTYATALLTLVIFLQTCGVKSNQRDTERAVVELREAIQLIQPRLDSLDQNVGNLPTFIEVEGLRSELRMIQATDRKMMDLQRQNVIEERIEALTKNK